MAKQQARITLTKDLAYAAGQDAGNRAMRAAGRNAWNDSDRDVAAHETLRMMLAGGHMTSEQAAQCGYAALPA